MENSYYAQYHTSGEAESVFTQVFGGRLTFCGFEQISPRKWVQDSGAGFKYFFYVNTANSGFSYLPWGALSLDFVPRLVAGRFKIQPKPKPFVHYSFSFEQKRRWDWTIDKNRENFRQKVEKIAGESVPEITAWFQRFKTVDDIVAAIDRTKSQSGDTGFYCYPFLVLAYAFALARIRRIEDAQMEFDRIIARRPWGKSWDEKALPELQKFFEAELAAGSRTD